jgi:hypothetical protein
MSNSSTADNLICTFCGTRLSSSYKLKHHIKTAKYCLELRQCDTDISDRKTCSDCGYVSPHNFSYNRHLETCSIRKTRLCTEEKTQMQIEHDKEMNELKSKHEIELKVNELKVKCDALERQLSGQISHPHVVNNIGAQFNITMNLQIAHSLEVLSPFSLLEKKINLLLWTWFKKCTFERGIKGLVDIIVNRILTHEEKQWLISYQPDKTTFHRKNDKGEIEIDDRAEMFLESLLPGIKQLVKNHSRDLLNEAADSSKEMERISNITDTFKLMYKKGTKERRKCVRTIADSISMSKVKLALIKNEKLRPRIEFCDELPNMVVSMSSASGDWGSDNSEYQNWKTIKDKAAENAREILMNRHVVIRPDL